jgi:imidazolonepropionase-like amidohydrolase
MRSRLPLILAGALALLPVAAAAQTTPVEGLRDNPPRVHALTNARIVAAPGRVLSNATLVIRDGVIEAVGANVRPPADARVWDLSGHTLYAGFIDAYSAVGMRTEVPAADTAEARGAVYWNPQVRSFVDAVAEYAADDDEGPASLRAQGFTVAHAVPQLGLFRGQTAVISLGSGTVADRVVRPGVAQSVTLARDNEFGFTYPTSAMGAIAFIRQTLHDADWHARARTAYERNPQGVRRPEANAALAALGRALRREQPLLIEARTEEEALRALRFRDEFPIQVWLRGSGSEYRLLDEFRGLDVPLILPVNFPQAPAVATAEQALNASLGVLRHWHLAPENPARLAGMNVRFAFTADGLTDRTQFLPNVRRAVERGLAPDVALAALTTVPAGYLGISATHGTLEVGRVANIVVARGDLFSDGTRIDAVWVDGERFELTAPTRADPRGEWRVAAVGPARFEGTLTLSGTLTQLTGSFAAPGAETPLTTARITGETPQLTIAFSGDVLGHEGTVRLSGSASADVLHGWGELPDGRRFNWTGERVGPAPDPSARAQGGDGNGNASGTSGSARAAPATLALADIRPALEYGRAGIPDQPQHVLVRNATVWTMGPEGILENADLLVTRGRVARVGRNLQAPAGAEVIDAMGKHVTPGLIDAHLHSGLSGGVNETGSAIVPEVQIGDVLTIDNIWMYRQLAGGLTTAHVMHGSANPIGGQNQHVKMRWGALPEELKFEGAPRTVKFALGENVKRRTNRYPDTRMGTEQIIRDHFLAAREYQREWQGWERGGRRGIPPRRDLRMDALVDIMSGDILVMSHAYRQDEMLMLMRIAEEFDFRIRAFHHGVEAYKLGPELAAHGAGAVVWSDWSSFKIEAYDATTYNARVLIDAGVLTSLHSDNSQIAARMNWEAAKMLRNGVSEQDALALVTINTAQILGIADRVGSLEAGKDADFVIWSAHPLSTETRTEQTWIDGRRYYDIEEDRRLREQVERERAQLLQLVLAQPGSQTPSAAPARGGRPWPR